MRDADLVAEEEEAAQYVGDQASEHEPREAAGLGEKSFCAAAIHVLQVERNVARMKPRAEESNQVGRNATVQQLRTDSAKVER